MESEVVVVVVVLMVVDDVDVGEICMGDELVAVIYSYIYCYIECLQKDFFFVEY